MFDSTKVGVFVLTSKYDYLQHLISPKYINILSPTLTFFGLMPDIGYLCSSLITIIKQKNLTSGKIYEKSINYWSSWLYWFSFM